MAIVDSSSMIFLEETEGDDFGDDIYAIPKMVPLQPSNPTALLDKAEEDKRIKALVETPALDWHRETHYSYGRRGGFGRGNCGRMMAGRGFGRCGLERKIPPPGYVCHRCKEQGHFIQHCPTKGDPDYDFKRVRPPIGIPKSMLVATAEGSYVLPTGAVVDIKPDEAAFDREMEGLSSTRRICDLPPELHCPLCKQVMRDAVLTSKCCFSSFCDKCIREYIISKRACICGATDVLADYLIPNITLRETIDRYQSSSSSSVDSRSVVVQVRDTGSDDHAQPKVRLPALSAASKDKRPLTGVSPDLKGSGSRIKENATTKIADLPDGTPELVKVKEPASQPKEVLEKLPDTGSDDHAQPKAQSPALSAASNVGDNRSPIGVSPDMKGNGNRIEEIATTKNADLPDGTPESVKAKEPASQPEEVREKLPDARMQSGFFEDFGTANCYEMPLSSYNPYWAADGMQWCFDIGMMALNGINYMGYEGPQDSFGAHGYLMPGPQESFGAHGYMIPGPQESFGAHGYMMPGPQESFGAHGYMMPGPQESFGAHGYMMPAPPQRSRGWSSKHREINGEVSSIADASLSPKSKHALVSQSPASERVDAPMKESMGSDRYGPARRSPHRAGKWKTSETGVHDDTSRPDQKRTRSPDASCRDGGSSKKRRPSEAPDDGLKDYERCQRPRPRPTRFRDDSRPATTAGHNREEKRYHSKRKPSRSPQRWHERRDGGDHRHSAASRAHESCHDRRCGQTMTMMERVKGGIR